MRNKSLAAVPIVLFIRLSRRDLPIKSALKQHGTFIGNPFYMASVLCDDLYSTTACNVELFYVWPE